MKLWLFDRGADWSERLAYFLVGPLLRLATWCNRRWQEERDRAPLAQKDRQ